MKKLGVLLLFCIALYSLPVHAANKKVIIVKTTISCDHCLQCGSCGQNINDVIRDNNKGIRKVKINAKENTISVTYLPEKTNPDAIRKAIAAAGFDADEVKAVPEAYENLDDCCKDKK